MSDLKPCPFCGGTNPQVRESSRWTGMRSVVTSVTVTHWCDGHRMQSIIQLTGKTHEDAVALWNTRARGEE